MARYLILEMKELTEWQMLAVGVSIILISLAILALRYGSLRFPSEDRLGPRWKAPEVLTQSKSNTSKNSEKQGTDL